MTSHGISRFKRVPGFFQRKILTCVEILRGKTDLRRLKRRIPRIQVYRKLAYPIRQYLQPYYEEYISTISTEVMAIGFETAVFMTVLCNLQKPKRILDLGSGFSSLVFRLYARRAEQKPEVYSVDDDQKWLQATRQYLATNQVADNNVTSWTTFTSQKQEFFDFILHDLGRMDVRTKTLENALSLAQSGGVIILDDVHKHAYRSHARRILDHLNLTYFSLRELTRDKFGRYCMLVTP